VGEDQPIVREGVVHVLEGAGFAVVGVADDADDLLRKALAHQPNVVITDIQMPPRRSDDGLQAARQIRASRPGVGVLVLSQFLEDRYALELVGDSPEGVGYLLKDRIGDVSTFTDAVKRVAGGGTVLDPEVVARLVGRRRKRNTIDRMSPRGREVLALMAEGLSNPGIAETLVVSVPAVERHISSIFAKLGLNPAPGHHRRVLAVLEYLRR
jgi:DNA-binding NarL/FixJ family response regulator